MQRTLNRTVERLRDKLVNQRVLTRMLVEEGEKGGNEGMGVLWAFPLWA